MGKRTRQREAVLLEIEEAIKSKLANTHVSRAVTKRTKRKEAKTGLKTLDPDRHLLEEMRLQYCKYTVPKFLFKVWTDKTTVRWTLDKYREWFFVVGRGDSLYKNGMKGILTKKGTFFFLKAPNDLSIEQNVWWARVRSLGGDEGTAYRIAKSRIGEKTFDSEFWISVARFFMVNFVSMKEMSELLDYLADAKKEKSKYSMKGRTLLSVQRLSYDWHKALYDAKDMKKLKWDGANLPNKSYSTGKADEKKQWNVDQLLTSTELAREGSAMHHCVKSYADSCATGNTSIWSLNTKDEYNQKKRCLTIEVRRSQVVQMRGYANRMAKPVERSIIKAWTRDVGITFSNSLY